MSMAPIDARKLHLATFRVPGGDSTWPSQLGVGRTDALLHSRQISGQSGLVGTLPSAVR